MSEIKKITFEVDAPEAEPFRAKIKVNGKDAMFVTWLDYHFSTDGPAQLTVGTNFAGFQLIHAGNVTLHAETIDLIRAVIQAIPAYIAREDVMGGTIAGERLPETVEAVLSNAEVDPLRFFERFVAKREKP